MSEIRLPKPVQAIVDAVNRADLTAFVAAFSAYGVVDDWDRRYVGPEEIGAWCKREVIGVKQSWKATSVEGHNGQVNVMIDVGGGGFNGPSRFRFTLDRDRVEEMKITGN